MVLESVFILYDDNGMVHGVYDSEDKALRAKQAWIENVVDCPFNDQAQKEIEWYHNVLAIEEVQVE